MTLLVSPPGRSGVALVVAGSISTEADLRTAMEHYAAADLGGLEITPIYGVRGYEDQFITCLDLTTLASATFLAPRTGFQALKCCL